MKKEGFCNVAVVARKKRSYYLVNATRGENIESQEGYNNSKSVYVSPYSTLALEITEFFSIELRDSFDKKNLFDHIRPFINGLSPLDILTHCSRPWRRYELREGAYISFPS